MSERSLSEGSVSESSVVVGSLGRRTVLGGIAAGAVASVAGYSASAGAALRAGATGRAETTLAPGYDAAGFEFDMVTLDARSPFVQWERQTTPTSPWEQIEHATGATYQFRPTWRDIGARFRAVRGDTARGQAVLTLVRLVAPALEGLDPADYGAIGDGTTDDTAALQATADAARAQGTGVDLCGRTYVVSDQVLIRNGVTAVFGGTLQQVGTVRSALYFDFYDGVGVDNCVFHDVTVELADPRSALGIGGTSAQHIAIVGCTVHSETSSGTGISLWNFIEGQRDLTDIVLRDNQVLLPDPIAHGRGGSGIYIDALLDWKGDAPTANYWRIHRRGWDKLFTTRDVYVAGNHVNGGNYGMSFLGVEDFTVEANHLEMNVRNISLQCSCHRAEIKYNTFDNSRSSAVHLAYGSSDNRITHNEIFSDRANGEGMLQAYVATDRNYFGDNRVVATSETGPKWHIYCGLHANDNVYERNILEGTCWRAYAAIEAAWDSTNRHPAHRATAIPSTDGYANQDSVGNKLIATTISPSSDVELICVADIEDDFGTWHCLDTEIVDNTTEGSDAPIEAHYYLG